MAELVPVSPLTLDLLASLAATDQVLAIADPTGAPRLVRSPVSGLNASYALLDASNIVAVTWRAAVGVPSGVLHAANSAARLALTGKFNGQLVIQDDTGATWSLVNDADPSNAASWDDLSVGSVAWADITGVPATFAPSAHTQTASTITDFATAVGLIAQPAVPAATEDNLASFDSAGFVEDSGIPLADVIQEGDARLTDARTPVAHNQAFSTITGDIDVAQFPVGLANQFLRINLAGTAIEWVSIPGGGDLLAANNLSELADPAEAAQNLSLEIGVDTQAWDVLLDSIAALSAPAADRILFYDFSASNFGWLEPSANFAITTTSLDVAATVMLKAGNLSGLANTGTSRGNLGVAIGTDVQAHSPYLDQIVALGDGGADRILFWDDSASAFAYLIPGTRLSITFDTIDVTGGSGTVTNTGGDLTANAVVLGAGTVDTKVVAGVTTDGTAQLVLGVNATALGSVKLFGNTSGDVTISPNAAAGTATALTLPATSGIVALTSDVSVVPANSQSADYTAVIGDAGKSIDHPSTDANARTFTIPANGSVAYPVGTCLSFSNMTAQVVTIAITTDTLYLAGAGTTGSRSLAQYGVATARKLTSTTWLISGTGLT